MDTLPEPNADERAKFEKAWQLDNEIEDIQSNGTTLSIIFL